MNAAGHLPSLLIHGPRGVGKRTVVAEMARRLGLRFLEVNVSDAPEFVRSRLFGAEAEAERASGADTSRGTIADSGSETPGTAEFVAPGELGLEEDKLVYLADFDRADKSLFQCFQQLVNGRAYVDACGNRWRISDYTWVVAGLNYADDFLFPSTVDLDHWVCASFEERLPLGSPQDDSEIALIGEAILTEYGCSAEPCVYEGLLEMIEGTPDRLHALKRWFADAVVRSGKGTSVRKAVLERAITNDLKTLFPRLRYRGIPLSESNFERWAEQFEGWRSIAAHIIREIAQRYYITEREYFAALNELASRSGIPVRGRVFFIKWQGLGESAFRVAHQLKNIAHWRVEEMELDLNKPESGWPALDAEKEHQFVVVDDFVGTGKTITPLFVGETAPVQCLLSRLPKARLFVGIIAGFENALLEVAASVRRYGDRVIFVPHKVFHESDRCFHETSRIFPQERRRERFRDFCDSIAQRHYPSLPTSFRLGFGGIGGLVVFPDTVPNNSIPILWHNTGTWFPVFPASGLPESTFDED